MRFPTVGPHLHFGDDQSPDPVTETKYEADGTVFTEVKETFRRGHKRFCPVLFVTPPTGTPVFTVTDLRRL